MPTNYSAEYERLRTKLQDLHRAPVPDLVKIDEAIQALEQVRKKMKAEQLGFKGNNPNE